MSAIVIGSGIAALAGLAGNMINSRNAKKARQKQEAEIAKRNAENENWFRSEYYKPQIERSENAYVINKAQQFFKDRALQDQKIAAITGSTNAAQNANKAQYSNAYSNLISQIAAGSSAQRDRIRAIYDANKYNMFNLNNNMSETQQQQYAAAGANWQNMATSAVNTGINAYAQTQTPKTT